MDNSNNGLLPTIWGSSAWNYISSVAFGYPINPTDDDKKHYMLLIENFAHTLPCPTCRISCIEFLKSEPTKLTHDVFQSRHELVKFVYKLHCRVNNKLGVKYSIDFNEFINKYESFRVKCMPNKEGCVMSVKDKQNGYINANKKDCQIIDKEIAMLFVNYANKRGINISNSVASYYNIDKKSDEWNNRNNTCYKLIHNMRLKGIGALETDGEFKGLPTKSELILISMLCSSMCKQDIDKVIGKLK